MSDIINDFVTGRGYRTYLQIGLSDDFANVNIAEKIAVDNCVEHITPATKEYTVCIDSDTLFANIDADQLFDIIYINGDHHYEQVVKDIANSKKHLSTNGVILLSNIVATDEVQTGTVYQAFVQEVIKSELSRVYTVYSIDQLGVIDTQQVKMNKDKNIINKYIDIIKSYADDSIPFNISNTLLCIYRIGFKDYEQNMSWLYPRRK